MTKLRILSFNVWGEGQDRDERWPLIVQAVAQLKADLGGFQEVFRRTDLEKVKMAGGFNDAFTPDFKTGLGLLTRGKIEASNSFILPFSPLEEYRRYIIFSRIEFGTLAVNFYNTHLSWKPEDTKTREVQSGAILGFIRSQASADMDILTGDLNAVEDTAAVKKLKTYFVDAFRKFRPAERGFTWSHSNAYTLRETSLAERRIDYVMIGARAEKKWKVKDASVVFDQQVDSGAAQSLEKLWISDHFGMCCDIEIEDS